MAKRAKMTAGPKAGKQAASAAPAERDGISPEDFQRIITEFKRQKDLASEYAGHAGKVVQSAVERHGLERTAFSMVLRLAKLEPAKQQAAIRALFQYVERAGMLDQMDAFSDLVTELEVLIQNIKARIPNAPRGDTVMSGLVN